MKSEGKLSDHYIIGSAGSSYVDRSISQLEDPGFSDVALAVKCYRDSKRPLLGCLHVWYVNVMSEEWRLLGSYAVSLL
jgi:hypothetical protein